MQASRPTAPRAPTPPTIEAIIRDLQRLKLGHGAADLRRFRNAKSLALIPDFQGTPDHQANVLWRYVDTMRDTVAFSPPTERPGRTPPPGQEWHRLLETIFNRSGSKAEYTERLRSISPQVPRDFPVLSTYYGVTTATSSRMAQAADDAVHLLARWTAVTGFADLVTPLAEPLSPAGQVPGTDGGVATATALTISTSAIQYSHLIVAHEHGATRIDRIPKRLSVLFKTEDAVVDIAEQRFGPGSTQIDAYVREHGVRKSQFYSQLRDGLICREIYSKAELESYVATGAHGRAVHLRNEHIQANLTNWLECLDRYRNYMVALTDEAVPLKYEIINGQTVVMHEAVGGNDRDRLNAVLFTGVPSGRLFQNDFDLIWDRTAIDFRLTPNVIKWAHHQLSGG
jgi:hypothetical protein